MVQRIRLDVRYDGTDFAGSQMQPGKRTVAGTLKAGLESLLGQPLKLDFASRTDAGVHADGNVCAFNADTPIEVNKLPQLLQRYLPQDLVVYQAQRTDETFHPRFDAISRSYVYRCWCREYPPVDRMRYVASYLQLWDLDAVSAALEALKGEHDFSRFSGSGFDPGNSRCTVHEASVRLIGTELQFGFTGNRFLRHMVVRLVGALAKVGAGERSAEAFEAMLQSGERFQFRPAPAKGLTLVAVQY